MVLCGKYLFEILVDTLKRANNKYRVTIPWYIMTSEENNKETQEFLEKHNFFGYSRKDVCLFKQGKLPLINKQGKLIIGKNMLIKEASNGNGGVFNSMKKAGIIEDLDKRKIEWVFVGGVDNILLKLVDPYLIGLGVVNEAKVASKTVLKIKPEERVGVFCKQNEKIKIIEYTEMPEEVIAKENEQAELVFGESHILANLFSIEAVKKASTEVMPYHIAIKKSSFINENGEVVKPKSPNCYKFERFLFDVFGLFENISILRGKREEDFAPIKNSEGEDSPETAKKLYNDYWKKC